MSSPAPGGYGPPPHPPYPGPGYGPQPPSKKPWALLAVAAGCILAMVIAIGGGITYLALSGRENPSAGPGSDTSPSDTPSTDGSEPPSSEPPGETPPPFKVISPIDKVDMTAEQVWQVMETNPLTQGRLDAIGSCDEIPATPVKHTKEQLTATLEASGSCLNQVWAGASSDRGLPWSAPSLQVYTWPDVPGSSCKKDSFEEDLPRNCHLDEVLYWPEGAGLGGRMTDPELVSQAYLWDLSFEYVKSLMWHSSLGTYELELAKKLGDDTEKKDSVQRRYGLQLLCLTSAATMRVPEANRPSQKLRDKMTDTESWGKGIVETTSRAHWIREGFESGGDLSKCNTWSAPDDLVK